MNEQLGLDWAYKVGQERMKQRCMETIEKLIKFVGSTDSGAALCVPYYEIKEFQLEELVIEENQRSSQSNH